MNPSKRNQIAAKIIIAVCIGLSLFLNTNAWPQQEQKIKELIQQLGSMDYRITSAASNELVEIGVPAVPKLISVLNDFKNGNLIRMSVEEILGRIGPAAKDAIPVLVKTLRKDKNISVRAFAAYALGEIGPVGKDVVPALIEALKKDNISSVREWASRALGKIGLASKDVIPALIEVLKNDENLDVREAAAKAMESIGPSAKDAVPALFEVFEKDENSSLRIYAAIALRKIGTATKDDISVLIKVLKNDENSEVRSYAAYVFGGLGPVAKDAVPALIDALKNDKGSHVREFSAGALGSIESYIFKEARRKNNPKLISDSLPIIVNIIIPEISKNLDGEDFSTFLYPLVEISEQIDDIRKMIETRELKQIIFQLKAGQEKLKSRGRTDNPSYEQLSRLIGHLEEEYNSRLSERINGWIKAHPGLWIVAALFAYVALFLILFWLSPITLLKMNNFFKSIKIDDITIASITIPFSIIRSILVCGLMYHPRVLDAWVRKYLPVARKNFEEIPTVAGRRVHILCLPLQIKKKPFTELKPSLIKENVSVKGSGRWFILIHGEGGAGKTSLACQLARWAMSDDKNEWITDHRMIPILIESDFAQEKFVELVAGRLQQIIEAAESLSEELVDHLLRKLRLLVIVDRFSELLLETQKKIDPNDKSFPVNALIVTSRLETVFGDAIRTPIHPQRIDGQRLTIFMEAYLNERKKREDFEDAEYLHGCLRLTEMVGDRQITPLFAKLFAEMMIASKEHASFKELPDNIPDLMLSYINRINRNRTPEEPDDTTIHRIAKAIAWVCIEPTYKPGDGKKAAVLSALAGESDLEVKLDYMEKKLAIVQTVGPAQDKIRITLDPLAEYFAGLRVIELFGQDESKWKEFIEKADKMEGAPESVRGFLMAVRDCCIAKGKDLNVCSFVENELAKRAGLDLEAVEQARLQQRIKRMIEQLKSPEAVDRKYASGELGKIGPASKNAILVLMETFKNDEDQDVRISAANALGKIGKDSFPMLVEAFENDKNPWVRGIAACALGDIGQDAKDVVPKLIQALKNDNVPFVRSACARSLGKIRWDEKVVVPLLIEALKNDADSNVRSSAVGALCGIGSNAKEAVPALIETLKNDESRDVCLFTAGALGYMGPEAKAAVPVLIEILKNDREWLIRRVAIESLGSIGPDAKDAVPALIEATKNGEEVIRKFAAEALRKIDPEKFP